MKNNTAKIAFEREKWESLKQEYPELYSNIKTFYVGIGWFDIIKDLSEKINNVLYRRWVHSKTWKADGIVVQVKEKFGTLRYYVDVSTPEIDKAIRDAEEKSAETCEECGAPGMLRRYGWIRTLCDKCNSNND